MTLTEEQIKNLKPGDSLVMRGTYIKQNSDGDIVLKCNITVGGKLAPDIKYFHPTCCSLPLKDLKYDPYRKFKKGDIVRLKEWNGRCPEMYSGTNSWFNHPPRCKNGNLEVREDEKDSKVEIGIIGVNCAHAAAAPCFLELVTPVEEMEPYYIEEKDIEFQVRMKYEDKDCLISVFRFKNIVEGYKQYYDMLPSMKQAREAAEAECERLNKDYNNKQK